MKESLGKGKEILGKGKERLTKGWGKTSGEKLRWDSWKNYDKLEYNGKEYASIGNRLYSHHAVDRMQPSGLGSPAGQIGQGRSISPNMVEEIIKSGASRTTFTLQNVERTIYSSGDFEVVTENLGKIMVTIKRIG